MNDFTTYIALNWHGLLIAVLLGIAIGIVIATPLPSRHDKPAATSRVSSGRKASHARPGGAR